MSTSSQPDAGPIQPADEEQEPVSDKRAVESRAQVMQWPGHNPRQSVANVRSELLARRQAILLRVIATFSSEKTLQGGLIAAVDALKMCFSGVRVSIGLYEHEQIRLAAISQQADVDSQTAESELICAVMLEAVQKDQAIVTDTASLSEQGMQAHRLLCAGRADRQVVSMPLCYDELYVGVLCLERDSRVPMVESSIALIRQVADMLAPLIQARVAAERGVIAHAKARIRQLLNITTSARYIKLKAIGLTLLAAMILGYLWQTTYWIKAAAELHPLERRVIASPREGYVQSVEVGSGDQVNAGDVLLRMNISDATVEAARWQSELNSLDTQMRAAMAVADRRQMAILAADIDKTKAQLALVESHLERSVVVAPVDGVVVSGDLSQMVGAPVSRGQLMLELAPEKGYEVHLMVDGNKINQVSTGDKALLKLQALTGEPLELVVDRIHPIGIAEDGANRFRVIASTAGDVALLRPGQTGIGKINVGKASVLQILTADFVAWLKLKKWEWLG